MRQQMGVFAQMFGYTPDQYRALSVRDYIDLVEHIKAVNSRA